MASLLVRNATILTLNDARAIVAGGVSIRDGRIAAVGTDAESRPHDAVIDGRGGYVLPGFVQTHIHLCQTLFRGLADDLPLLDWLRRRIWPLEAAHIPASLAAATRLASAELLLGGTTTVLTMETVHDTDIVFDTLAECGLRATVGKCMMDDSGDAPPRLRETTARAVEEGAAIASRWNGAAGGRLRAALAPRFALSCTRELLEAVAGMSRDLDLIVHTHAAENRDEVALVRDRTGLANVDYLAMTGLASPRLCAAHCVWVDEFEQSIMAERGIKMLHCPGSNLKLGSGVAPVIELRRRGISVSLGADGAACNNQLDMFSEMRLAATLQAVRHGPGALTAGDVLWMATREGARALGLDSEIGSIEPGKRADLVVVDRDRPHLACAGNPVSAIVYAARASDVRATIVDGVPLVQDFHLTRMDASDVAAHARTATRALLARAGI
jgi:5-methylthioadenosine/S-adenosylhomocysteine deaminase